MIHPAIVVGSHPSVLDRLTDPTVRLVVWDRPNPSRMDSFPESACPTPDELCCLPDWLIDDIGVVGELYVRATGGDWRVRLETASERTCPRFHEDANTLRFLVTYRGPGTEWTTDLNSGVVGTAPTGALVAVKGSAWPRPAAAVLHRSAKANRRRPRWILAMDAVPRFEKKPSSAVRESSCFGL